MDPALIEESKEAYMADPTDELIMKVAASVEHDFYCRYTRLEDTIEFCKRMGAKKIGIATCVGLIGESKILARVLVHHGFEVFGISCKAGEVDKVEMGVHGCEETGCHLCNPILQAKRLAQEGTDINIVMGLCVGHDSLFYRHSVAPCTTLVAKDRVLGHNTVAALQMVDGYYHDKLFGKQSDSEKE